MRAALITMAVAALAFSNCAAAAGETLSSVYPYFCSGALRDAELAKLGDNVIARSESITVTRKTLDAQIEKLTGSTRDQARKYPIYVLERYITRQLTLIEAKDWAKKSGRTASSDDELIRSYLAARIPKAQVSEEEAESFYKEHVNMFGGSTYEQVKDTVFYFVRDEKTSRAEDEFNASMGKRHKILVSESWIRSEHERWSRNPVEQARISGKPTYVNFGVIGCCDKMNPVTEALRSRYGRGELNVVFVHVGEEEVLSELYGVKTIPVQLLFDKDGKLLLRHQGNMTLDQVVSAFAEHGVDLGKGTANE